MKPSHFTGVKKNYLKSHNTGQSGIPISPPECSERANNITGYRPSGDENTGANIDSGTVRTDEKKQRKKENERPAGK